MAPDHDELDSRTEYDLEDEDLAWLATARRTGSRLLRQSLSEDLVERLIDRFEKELHSVVGRHPNLWMGDQSHSSPLDLDVGSLYPLSQARQVRSAFLACC